MMTANLPSSPFRLLVWQKKNVSQFLWVGIAAWVLIEPLHMTMLELPVMPITVVGTAIGVFTSFRANQAYDRWWEGRKLWGKLINTSRHWCNQVHHYVKDDDIAHELVDRQITYVHALRCLLRKQDPFADPDFVRLLRDEDHELRGATNLTHALLDRQLEALVDAAASGELDERRLQSLDVTLMDLLNIQGGCERIKGTPLPRGYGYIAEMLVHFFAMMLPFAMVHQLGWVAIPLNALVCLSLALISEAGRVLEDPFTVFYNGLPLHSLSIKIERNLLERRGVDLPPPVEESPSGILM